MSKENMNQLDLPFKDKLYRFALKYVSNSFDAEDIIQDLMIKIWKRMDQYTDIENKEAWCMTVTRNLAIDRIRRRKKDAIKDISDYHHLSNNDVLQDKKLNRKKK